MSLQFTADAKARLEAIARRYPKRSAALLPALHLAQKEFGHLSLEVQAVVAEALGVPHVDVHECVTFYEMFHQHAEGQFHLEICSNISCHLAGADALVDHCKKRLGIEVGHQTEDGVFGLMEAECLASCGSAPMMRVGFDYYEFLSAEALDALIDRFKKIAPTLNGKAYEHGPEGPHVGPVRGFEPKAAGVAAPAPAPAAAKGTTPKGSVPPPEANKGPKATSIPPEPPKDAKPQPTAEIAEATQDKKKDLPSFQVPPPGKKDPS